MKLYSIIEAVGYSVIFATMLILSIGAFYTYYLGMADFMILDMNIIGEWIIEVPLLIFGTVFILHLMYLSIRDEEL